MVMLGSIWDVRSRRVIKDRRHGSIMHDRPARFGAMAHARGGRRAGERMERRAPPRGVCAKTYRWRDRWASSFVRRRTKGPVAAAARIQRSNFAKLR
jgi:hypothetical protein